MKISKFYRYPNYALVYLDNDHLYDISCVPRIELQIKRTFKKTVWVSLHSKQS